MGKAIVVTVSYGEFEQSAFSQWENDALFMPVCVLQYEKTRGHFNSLFVLS